MEATAQEAIGNSLPRTRITEPGGPVRQELTPLADVELERFCAVEQWKHPGMILQSVFALLRLVDPTKRQLPLHVSAGKDQRRLVSSFWRDFLFGTMYHGLISIPSMGARPLHGRRGTRPVPERPELSQWFKCMGPALKVFRKRAGRKNRGLSSNGFSHPAAARRRRSIMACPSPTSGKGRATM